VHENHPSLHDDLWGQYWLAGVAAGLSYCHKAGLPDDVRLTGIIYAAANMRLFFKLFELPMPNQGGHLYSEAHSDRWSGSVGPTIHPAQIVHDNLPASLTNFIGRKAELDELIGLLLEPEVRLVTLTGPGGTGKTRLALEAARGLLQSFSNGVFFIDLGGITDPTLVASTTAHTLGIREGGGQPPIERLRDYLASKHMLLIFDNFEQITEASHDITKLLTAAPGLKVLVTSRIPLNLRGEHEYPVSPLEMPSDLDQPLDELLTYESVALFQQQAKAVQPRFEVTDENRAAVVEICQRLDGLPLAIEIAAARTKMLTPAGLLQRLDHSLHVLVGGAKDLPDRQQTLRRAIDWSFQLLEPAEQELFIRLGIFNGGFTLEAADEICSTMDEMDVFQGIEILLNNSLLHQVHSDTEEPRFDMLQTIREFALEKAAESEILDELERAHCFYFTQLAGGGMEGGIYGPDSILWLRRYEQEHDNFRTAMAWALAHPDEGVMPLMAIMTQLSWFWYRYGYLQEGSEWTERALNATEGMGDSPARAFALGGRGSLALWSGDLVLAAQRTREAMEMGQRLSIDLIVSLTKMTYGTTLVNQGRDKEAYPHLVDAVELFDEGEQSWLKGTALVHLANVSLGMGDVEQALHWLEIATPLLNTTGDIWCMAFGLNNYGEVARTQGDYERAEEYYLRTEALYTQADSKGDQARLLTALGYIAQHKGEFDKATSLFLESLDEFRKLGNQRGIAECLAGLAGLAAERGNPEWGTPLLSAAERQLNSIDGVWWPADRVEIERAKEAMLAALGDDFEEQWTKGLMMSMDDVIAYATSGG
jgi:predicted ATPase